MELVEDGGPEERQNGHESLGDADADDGHDSHDGNTDGVVKCRCPWKLVIKSSS